MNLTEMDSNSSVEVTTANETLVVFIEIHPLEVKLLFVGISTITLITSVLAMTAMNRSKRVPYVSKFLSTGLLTFDDMFIVLSTLRKFVSHPVANLHIQNLVNVFLGLSHFTVGLMSLERYILMLKPILYLKHFSDRRIRQISFALWICEVTLSQFFRFGVCYAKRRSIAVFTVAGECNAITSYFTACTSYWKIFKCIQSKITTGETMKFFDTARVMKTYRSTSLVFTYLLFIIPTVGIRNNYRSHTSRSS
jgi:hypothetical protein